MHAAVLPHQPTESAILSDMFVEPDQVVVVPRQVRHGLVSVIEDSFAERIAIPFQARHFTGLAADAGGNVDYLAHLVIARCVAAGHRSGVSGDGLDFQRSVAHLALITPSPASPGIP